MFPTTGNFFHASFLDRRVDELIFSDNMSSKRLETKLKKNFPSTLMSAIGIKSLMLEHVGGLFLGMYTSLAHLH